MENEIIKYKVEGIWYPIPYKYSKFLVYSSFSMGIASLIALYLDDTYISIYFFLLWLTSINFWRKPEYGMRRNIDWTIAYIGVIIALFEICLLKNEFNRVGVKIV
jgi:hypothetical protein